MITVHGEPSFQLTTAELDLTVTARGGQMAPVAFHLPGRDVTPYALAPWQPAEYPEIPSLLSVLRGDFFCLPFGGQLAGPPHGDPANAEWSLEESDERSLKLVVATTDTGAKVEKLLSVRPRQHAVFMEHRISGLAGNHSYGTHPILDFSGLAEGAGRISTSEFRWASTFPGTFSDPAAGETQALAESAEFADLREVPLAVGGTTDLTRYPARLGNDDLVMMASTAATAEQPFAWSAAVLDGYLWFALKNPDDFPATLFWFSNEGRTAAPWLGRHRGRVGIEEVCSYFSCGEEESRKDLLSAYGIATSRRFDPKETVVLRTIHAVALVPEDFGTVCQIVPHTDSAVEITGTSHQKIMVTLDWPFIT